MVAVFLFKPYYAWLPLERYLCGEPTKDNFFLVDDQDFQRLGRPLRGDWLDQHSEWGESFFRYLWSEPARPDEQRTQIVLQPLGTFNAEQEQLLKDTQQFCKIFFMRPATLAEPIPLNPEHSRARDYGPQYRTPQLLTEVLKPNRPPEAFCYLGVTVEDLTYQDSWNFVYGSAIMNGQVGVFSLARYFPEFRGEARVGDPDTRILRRSCAVMAHEAAHSLGMGHCVYYGCLMQGSNHLQELDEKPLYLCPICLAKLKWNLDCDLDERYAKLLQFFEEHGLDGDAAWLKERLRRKTALGDR